MRMQDQDKDTGNASMLRNVGGWWRTLPARPCRMCPRSGPTARAEKYIVPTLTMTRAPVRHRHRPH